ncbi:anti-sigma factor [Novosphingopyxis iocasae]|uniref:anti-sigma factor n=1 Tax=Novosphingopyxis iocasae TaxID=2762729 RepID=UPI0016514274|nr:anti-sigma factor [Novosphingopyxis iocasae]
MIDQPMTDETRMLLAAELVLGLLSEAERAEALEQLARDPELAVEVRRWEAHLAPLFAGFENREPSRDLYPEIRARLDAIEHGTRPVAPVAPIAANENSPRGVASGWRAAAIGFAVLAAGLGGLQLFDRRSADEPVRTAQTAPVPDGPDLNRILVAQLTGDQGPRLVASAEQGQSMLRIRAVGADGADASPQGSVPVLWIIAGDQAPKAVGTIGSGGTVRDGEVTTIALQTTLRQLLDSGATLAVTYEPAGEGQYEAPTTPIVASGTVSHI